MEQMSVHGQKLRQQAEARVEQLCALEKKHSFVRWEATSPEYTQAATERKSIAIKKLHKALEVLVSQHRKCRKVLDRRSMFDKRRSRKEGVRLNTCRLHSEKKIAELIVELKLWHQAPGEVPLFLVGYDAESMNVESLLASNEDGSAVSMPWQSCFHGFSTMDDCIQRLLRAREEKSIIRRECRDSIRYYDHYLTQLQSILATLVQHAQVLDGLNTLPCSLSPCDIDVLLAEYMLPCSVYCKYNICWQRLHAGRVVRGRINVLKAKIRFMEECRQSFVALMSKIDQGWLDVIDDSSDTESILHLLEGDPGLLCEDDVGDIDLDDFSLESSDSEVEDKEAVP
jgi:hypothetical protein